MVPGLVSMLHLIMPLPLHVCAIKSKSLIEIAKGGRFRTFYPFYVSPALMMLHRLLF